MEMMLRLVLSRRCEARVRGEGQTPVAGGQQRGTPGDSYSLHRIAGLRFSGSNRNTRNAVLNRKGKKCEKTLNVKSMHN